MWNHKWEELWHCGAPEVYSLYQRCTFTDFCPSDHNDLTAEGMRACLYDKQEHFLINHGKTLSPLLTTHPVHHLSSLWQWTEISDNPPHLWFVPFFLFPEDRSIGMRACSIFSTLGSKHIIRSAILPPFSCAYPTPWLSKLSLLLWLPNALSSFTQASKKEALAMTTQKPLKLTTTKDLWLLFIERKSWKTFSFTACHNDK